MKAHTQVQSYRGMLASLLGNLHITFITYHHFLHAYDQVFTHLKGELDSAYGWRLAPCLVNFHVQRRYTHSLAAEPVSLREPQSTVSKSRPFLFCNKDLDKCTNVVLHNNMPPPLPSPSFVMDTMAAPINPPPHSAPLRMPMVVPSTSLCHSPLVSPIAPSAVPMAMPSLTPTVSTSTAHIFVPHPTLSQYIPFMSPRSVHRHSPATYHLPAPSYLPFPAFNPML
jgi:hypothetical protein